MLNIKLSLQVTDYSLIILIKASRISGTQSYQGVMNAAFGKVGYTVLSILQFVYPFIGNIHGLGVVC
jgi:sodium-coupled neutral amino acid transporter 11